MVLQIIFGSVDPDKLWKNPKNTKHKYQVFKKLNILWRRLHHPGVNSSHNTFFFWLCMCF